MMLALKSQINFIEDIKNRRFPPKWLYLLYRKSHGSYEIHGLLFTVAYVVVALVHLLITTVVYGVAYGGS